MISTLDLLYIVLTVATIVITSVVACIGLQLVQVLRDVGRIAATVEELSQLVERVIGRLDRGERKVGDYLEKQVDKLIRN